MGDKHVFHRLHAAGFAEIAERLHPHLEIGAFVIEMTLVDQFLLQLQGVLIQFVDGDFHAFAFADAGLHEPGPEAVAALLRLGVAALAAHGEGLDSGVLVELRGRPLPADDAKIEVVGEDGGDHLRGGGDAVVHGHDGNAFGDGAVDAGEDARGVDAVDQDHVHALGDEVFEAGQFLGGVEAGVDVGELPAESFGLLLRAVDKHFVERVGHCRIDPADGDFFSRHAGGRRE